MPEKEIPVIGRPFDSARSLAKGYGGASRTGLAWFAILRDDERMPVDARATRIGIRRRRAPFSFCGSSARSCFGPMRAPDRVFRLRNFFSFERLLIKGVFRLIGLLFRILSMLDHAHPAEFQNHRIDRGAIMLAGSFHYFSTIGPAGS